MAYEIVFQAFSGLAGPPDGASRSRLPVVVSRGSVEARLRMREHDGRRLLGGMLGRFGMLGRYRGRLLARRLRERSLPDAFDECARSSRSDRPRPEPASRRFPLPLAFGVPRDGFRGWRFPGPTRAHIAGTTRSPEQDSLPLRRHSPAALNACASSGEIRTVYGSAVATSRRAVVLFAQAGIE
jgi:hypothetical protein